MIELRRQGLSTYEISARLAGDGTPLNRTSVGRSSQDLLDEGDWPAAQAGLIRSTSSSSPLLVVT